MKASEIREIRKMTPEQLNEKLTGLKKDLFPSDAARHQSAGQSRENPGDQA